MVSDTPTSDETPAAAVASFRFGINHAVFSDGQTVEFPSTGVVLLVGPNNAGKSVALRDIVAQISVRLQNRPPTRVVAGLQIAQEGGTEEFADWLQANAFRVERPDGRGGVTLHYQRPNANHPWAALQREWEQQAEAFPAVSTFFLFHASAEQRLGLVGAASTYNPTTEAPSNPLQVLFAHPDLEESISDTCYEAFGSHLTLARVWGSNLQLHLGQTQEPVEMPSATGYIEALKNMPLLQEQGDGMRSFMGLMLALVTAQFSIILVDEPEAFLHPPQARLLGRKLATETPQGTQVFVATHDSDILQGILAPADADVTVIRLVREGPVNRASVLRPAELRAIWGDPLLRYSNVLDGLFHTGVVVSESDADSRYYSAVLDARRERSAQPPHDLLFTQSGGKNRLPVVIGALRALDIPVAVVADFDVLQDDALLERLVVDLGGDWSRLETHWRVVASAVATLGAAPLVTSLRTELKHVLDREHGPNLSRDAAKAIRTMTRLDDSWARLKNGGLALVPQGDASAQAQVVLDELASLGLFVVPVGELERWEPDLPGHGPRWVAAAIESKRHDNAGSPTERFVDRVSGFFS
jgi:ABC-type cobalamin/Fe3+-siderophores transport system ATPase subunit